MLSNLRKIWFPVILIIFAVFGMASCSSGDTPSFSYPYFTVIEYDHIYDEYSIIDSYSYEWEGEDTVDALNLNNLDINVEYILVEVSSYGIESDLKNGYYRAE